MLVAVPSRLAQLAGQADGLGHRKGAAGAAVQAQQGRLAAGAIALDEAQAEGAVGRALAQFDPEDGLQGPADVLRAFQAAGRAAAPGDVEARRRLGADLRVERQRAEDLGRRRA
jgi:hypothetical protein